MFGTVQRGLDKGQGHVSTGVGVYILVSAGFFQIEGTGQKSTLLSPLLLYRLCLYYRQLIGCHISYVK